MSSERFRERLLSGDQLAIESGGQLASTRALGRASTAVPARKQLLPSAAEAPRSRSARWQPQHWRLRTKLLALTLVPLVLALVLGGLRIADVAKRSNSTAVRELVIMGIVVLVALIVLTVLARSILKPLRVLRASAFDVADRRLPAVIELLRTTEGRSGDLNVEPVPVYSREDVGQVARAFDAVHSEAVRLAAEQAALRANVNDMFVNLSRRSQSLVERQLQLIDQLELGEQDSDRLAALFRLDHLATRMRRNGENLLVLAGAELRQRSGEPVPIVDVLRAAVSEIEDYQRVTMQQLPPAMVSGLAVNDIVHLIAELLDNATAYSSPESLVTLSARFAENRGLAIEISDEGAGIPRARLNAINQRLAAPPAVDVSVSRQMGLFVVGRLANRHGITVQLSSQEGLGVAVTVTLPKELITSGPGGGAEPDQYLGIPSAPPAQPAAPAQPATFGALIDHDPFPTPAPSLNGLPTYVDPLPQERGLFEDLSVNGNSNDTPIFQAMLSRWFTERQEPPSSAAEYVSPPAPAHEVPTQDAALPQQPVRETPVPASPGQDDWESEADDGWRAAEAASEPVAEELTAAGLPKRRPQAFLVPGSVRSATGEHPIVGAARNADVVRGRMSSYQRGLTLGRHARPGTGSDQVIGTNGLGRHSWAPNPSDQVGSLGQDKHDDHKAEGTL